MSNRYIAFVDDAVIVCRLRGIYNVLNKNVYHPHARTYQNNKACALINETIRTFQSVECEDKKVVSELITVLYLTLVDIAMKRKHAAHDRVRNMFYKIESRYMR